ncbi:MAG: trigger factor [Blastochloris sp.]|nr:trigger factor [Blastochloris sp.]
MNIAIEEVSACRRRLRIEVPAQDVDAELKKITDEFQKLAQIKGFRAGKAPRAVVEKKFSKDIEEEVKRKIVPQAYREALKTKKLNVVSAPQVEELKFQRGISLSFSTLIDLAPEFSLPEYKGLKIKRSETAVTDEDMDRVINNILEQNADYQTVTQRPVAEKDFAIISYEGSIDGKPVSEFVPDLPNLHQQEKFWLLIQEGIFLPGFGQQLIGAQPGDKRSVNVTFPDDFPQEVLRGKQAVYQVSVEELKEKILPSFDDAMAEKVAKTSAEELKSRIRENIARQKEQQGRSEEVKQIIDQLKAAVNFELPESTVLNQTQRAVYNIVRENQMRGIPADMLEQHKNDIFSAAQTSAKDQVKVGFILSKISEAEKIEVKTDEILEVIHSYAQQENVPVQKMVKQLQENNGLEQIEEEIRNRKTIDFLLQSAISE